MKTIPLEDVEAVMDRMSHAAVADVQRIAERMQKRQPYIMVYLLAAEENLATDEEEQGWLLSLGGVICEVMHGAQPRLRQVTGDELLAAEEANVKLLESLEEGAEMGFNSAVENLLTTYNQTPLLGTMLSALMSGHEEEPELAPDNIGLAFLHLKAVIDCLDQ